MIDNLFSYVENINILPNFIIQFMEPLIMLRGNHLRMCGGADDHYCFSWSLIYSFCTQMSQLNISTFILIVLLTITHINDICHYLSDRPTIQQFILYIILIKSFKKSTI